MKRLRGTPFDVFGWDRDRRTERAAHRGVRAAHRRDRPARRPPCRTTRGSARRLRHVDQGLRRDQGDGRRPRGGSRSPPAAPAGSRRDDRVIKRLPFATRRRGRPGAGLRGGLAARRGRRRAGAARTSGRRASRCASTLPDLSGPDPQARRDRRRVVRRRRAPPARSRTGSPPPTAGGSRRQADRVADRDASPVIVAEESVLRGADWLGQRWRDGGSSSSTWPSRSGPAG